MISQTQLHLWLTQQFKVNKMRGKKKLVSTKKTPIFQDHQLVFFFLERDPIMFIHIHYLIIRFIQMDVLQMPTSLILQYSFINIIKMQNTPETKNLIYKWEAITHILPFLNLSDMLSTSSLSKQWNYNLNQYIKKAILPSNLENLNSNAFATLKMFYHRKIDIFQDGKQSQHHIPFIVDDISVGNLVTSLKLIDGTYLLTYNSKLETNEQKDWKQMKDVIKLGAKFQTVKCIGDFVYCIKEQQILRYQPNEEAILAKQNYLNFNGDVKQFLCSFTYALVVVGHQPRFMSFSHKTFQPQIVTINKSIKNTDQICVFQNSLLFCVDGIPYEMNLESAEKKISQIKMLKGKNIAKIYHGYRHCFAFQRKNKLLSELNTNQVLKWAESQGFDDYLKIFKTQKVTGKKLLQMEKSYMENVLGITGVKIQQRMKVRINQCNEQNPQDYNIYAWGRNDKGQLCANPSANVTNAMKIKLPENCIIWKCLGDRTFIKNIKNQEIMMTNHQGNKLTWDLINKSKLWAIDNCKNQKIICLSASDKEKIPQAFSEVPIHHKKEKLRTAKNIMDKILWDQNLEKQDFRVGYLDKYTGMLESSLDELLKTQVKQYRIMYFKKKGNIVWDKKARIDVL